MIFGVGFGGCKNHFFENGLNHPQNLKEPARKIFARSRWLFENQFVVICKNQMAIKKSFNKNVTSFIQNVRAFLYSGADCKVQIRKLKSSCNFLQKCR